MMRGLDLIGASNVTEDRVYDGGGLGYVLIYAMLGAAAVGAGYLLFGGKSTYVIVGAPSGVGRR